MKPQYKPSNPGIEAMIAANTKNKSLEADVCELYISLMIAHNSIATYHVDRLCDMLLAESPKDLKDKNLNYSYGAHGVKNLAKLIKSDLKAYNDIINHLMHHVHKRGVEDDRTARQKYLDFAQDLANTLDDSDEILGKIVTDMDEFIHSRIPKFGEIKPADPEVVAQLIKCAVLVGLSPALFNVFNKGSRYMSCSPNYRALSLDIINRRLDLILIRIRMKNQYGKPLPYCFDKLLCSEEIHGKKNKNGIYDHGFTTRYRDAICSTRFADRVMLLRDGIDMRLRDHGPSIFTQLWGSYDVPKMPETNTPK